MEKFSTANNYILEDDYVLLRPLERADHANLLPFSENEPDLWKYSLFSAAGKENLEKYIDDAVTAAEKGTEYAFIIFDKKKDQFAGSTRFYDIQLAHGSMQLGYTWYGSDFQGTGLNKRCKLLLLQFAFEDIGMERIELRADVNNARSIAAMKSIGCSPEGVFRNHLLTHSGLRRSSIVLSMLKNEWFNGGKKYLTDKIALLS